MNPYESSTSEREEVPKIQPVVRGKQCASCGSTNTAENTVLRARPSIIFFLFFGWLYLLIRGAFAMRNAECKDCGFVTRYKSHGSYLALSLLILVVILLLLAFVAPSGNA